MAQVDIAMFMPPEPPPEQDVRLMGSKQISITVPYWVVDQVDRLVDEFDHLSRSGVISLVLEATIPDVVKQLEEIMK